MRIAILGGGLSGISLYDILNRKYGIVSDIYEKNDKFGGLCRTEIIDGYVYDLSGGHVFNSKYKEVKEYIFELLDKSNWQYSERKSKIKFGSQIIDYPFEFSLSKVDKEIAADCIESLFKRNNEIKINSFKDALVKNFGEKIYEYYLGPYNEKIWKFSPADMDFDWIEGKLPFPNAREILIKTLNKDTKEEGMSHSTYYYPVAGGIQTMIDAISESIPSNNRYEGVEKIEFKDSKIYINKKEYDLVVNTIPLPELKKLILKLDENILNAIDNLKYNSVHSFLYPIDKENDYSWMYIPDKKIIPHRIVYQGNFAEENSPKGKSSITVEITKPELYTKEEMLENISNFLGLKNPIAENFTKYAYVIFDKHRKDNMSLIKDYFKNRNLILHGRFAEWEYPNMDICIKKSMNLAEFIMTESKNKMEK
ncbi:UDP-galactopyranose mutase [Hypnocyclicus thermotrophus]|uniref:UDP-galactopyranose mutase n=1 Tax=Hypnocyclicus thermotrophus TaxID=1627895 RepID=A0AA46DX94_9FUSO|nr:NAD(P)-binding protein [Hypnocyclicus thermotrophus]TDT67873.1 UDP-galactopyranose mutase [Hypnocyclicus thermotrophus]